MSEIVLYSENSTELQKYLEKNGRKLYQKNENYQNIANVMENPEFRKLFDRYFDDKMDIQLILTFMKVYQQIEKNSNVPLSGYQKIAILDKMFKNPETRKQFFQNPTKLIEG